MEAWVEDIRDATVKRASEIVSGLLSQSIYYMIYNDQDAALANERMARFVYRRYQTTMGDTPRTQLPPYSQMKQSVVEGYRRTLPEPLVKLLNQKIMREQMEAAAENKPPSTN